MQRRRVNESMDFNVDASHGKENDEAMDRSCGNMMMVDSSSFGQTLNNNNSGGRWEVTYCEPKDSLKKTRRNRTQLDGFLEWENHDDDPRLVRVKLRNENNAIVVTDIIKRMKLEVGADELRLRSKYVFVYIDL